MVRFTARNYARIAKAALTRSVPVYAHFGITHRCNLTCKMCGIWRYGDEECQAQELAVWNEIRQPMKPLWETTSSRESEFPAKSQDFARWDGVG